MTKGRFGGDAYKPKGLGADPAAPAGIPALATSSQDIPLDPATLAALKGVKVPFASRINVAADRQLKALAREGRTQTDLLAEALNLLFEKHGRDRVA